MTDPKWEASPDAVPDWYTQVSIFNERDELISTVFNADAVEIIAAAPETAAERDHLRAINADLLAALEEVRRRVGHIHCSGIITGGPCTCHVATVDEAIAKARGIGQNIDVKA
jgi:hypothetical protein